MIESKPCCQKLGVETSMKAPFDEVIAFGYYDGPTDGILRCGGCDQEYRFEMIDSRSEASGEDDIRIFELSRLPNGSLASFTTAMSQYQQPSRPFWLPRWSFPSDQQRDEMNALVERIIGRKGPVEWVVASSSWLGGEILAVRSISETDAHETTDWFASLGLVRATIED